MRCQPWQRGAIENTNGIIRRDMPRKTDIAILLSEVQLYQPEDAGKIQKFNHHPAMERFSRLAFERTVLKILERCPLHKSPSSPLCSAKPAHHFH
jgi:hypothetical protein